MTPLRPITLLALLLALAAAPAPRAAGRLLHAGDAPTGRAAQLQVSTAPASVLWRAGGFALAAVAACEPHLRGGEIRALAGKRYALAWRAVPAIRVGEFFALDVAVCANDGQPRIATLRVDAALTASGQGMNQRASVRPQGTDRFVVEGLVWHLPGTWELRFDINAGADRESLVTTVSVQ